MITTINDQCFQSQETSLSVLKFQTDHIILLLENYTVGTKFITTITKMVITSTKFVITEVKFGT